MVLLRLNLLWSWLSLIFNRTREIEAILKCWVSKAVLIKEEGLAVPIAHYCRMELLYLAIGLVFLLLLLLFVAVNLYYVYIHRKYAHLPTPKGAGYAWQ